MRGMDEEHNRRPADPSPDVETRGMPEPATQAMQDPETGAMPDSEDPEMGARPKEAAAIDSAGERFVPGTILAGRYRIVGTLGRGGMGEVFRAVDIRLGQTVALKFRPRGSETDVTRLLHEVRVAREIAHPNVCRIYDIVESGDEQFLAMEYVDGEDLSSLLRRIGRVPGDKAIEIARQLCSGLAGIHDRGVLHRDLKPANVMLDGRGRVRITDFGIASSGAGRKEDRQLAGTPAYMAPELLAGGEATRQSDLYALGALLYEVFTGKHPFATATAGGGARDRLAPGPAPAPSTLLSDMHPAVEQVILRCLDPDPALRPPSVMAVAAALPGFDPLAEAVAAGQTPSPEMVAEAGKSGALSARSALGLLSGAFILMLTVTVLQSSTNVVNRLPIDKPPAVMNERAMQILKEQGYTARPAQRIGRYETLRDSSRPLPRTPPGFDLRGEAAKTRPWPVVYRYRSSPRAMLPHGRLIGADDPPFIRAGMTRLTLDLEGRLVAFEVVAPGGPDSAGAAAAAPAPASAVPAPAAAAQTAASAAAAQAATTTAMSAAVAVQPDWSTLFTSAGLKMSDFREETPVRAPAVPSDHVQGWRGALPESPSDTLRIAAGSYGGRPVSFVIYGSRGWSGAVEERVDPEPGSLTIAWAVIAMAVLTALFLGIAGFVYLAYRRGRWDRRLARNTAVSLFVMTLVGWLLSSDLPAGIQALGSIPKALKHGLLIGALCWLLYVALEPLGRRYWPHGVIGWTRLTSGRFRDPLVGRDILAGALLGILAGLLGVLAQSYLPRWVGDPPAIEMLHKAGNSLGLGGGRRALGMLLTILPQTLFGSVVLFFLYLLPRTFLRNRIAALAITFGAYLAIRMVGESARGTTWPAAILEVGAAVVLLAGMIRFGILTGLVASFCLGLLRAFPFTWDLSLWYAGVGATGVVVVASIAAYGAWVASRRKLGTQGTASAATLGRRTTSI
ncbi:MAG: serine/threonine-protein kinase [Candidatus Eisenbacteria bacterium]